MKKQQLCRLCTCVLHVSTSCCLLQNDNVKRPNLTFCDEPQYTRFSPAKQVPSIPVSFLDKRHSLAKRSLLLIKFKDDVIAAIAVFVD